MSTCPRCSTVLPVGAKFCPLDGTPTVAEHSNRKCARCGQPVGVDHSFCQNCGSVVEELEVPKSAPLPPPEGARMEHPDPSLWFMPALPRTDAEKMLAAEQTGTFLVRASSNSPGAYDLCVKGHDKVYHFLINYDGAQYRLSSPTAQPFFNSVDELVKYHFRKTINDSLLLTRPARAAAPRAASLPQSPPPDFRNSLAGPSDTAHCVCGTVSTSAFCRQCGRPVGATAASPARASAASIAVTPELALQIRSKIEEAKSLLDLMPLAATIVHAEEQCLLNAREIKQLRGDYKAKRAFFAMGLPSSLWEADLSASVCKHCSKAFSVTRRRHHCRCCGSVLCNKCCSQSLFRGGLSLERLCMPCLKFLQDVNSGKVPAVPS